MGEDSTHRNRQHTCPYLGCWWDREIRSLEPDPDNRCFAREQRFRLWPFRTRTKPGARIYLTEQKTTCYGDFHRCDHFRGKTAS